MHRTFSLLVTAYVMFLAPSHVSAAMWRVTGPFASFMSADGACVSRGNGGGQVWLDCDFGDENKTTFLMMTLPESSVPAGKITIAQREDLLGEALRGSEWRSLLTQIKITSGSTQRQSDVRTLISRGFLYDGQQSESDGIKKVVAMKVVANSRSAVAVVAIGNFQYLRDKDGHSNGIEEKKLPETVEAMLLSFQLDL